MRKRFAAIASGLPLLLATGAGASETQSYSYDARGRLVTVAHSGGPNAGLASCYSFDNADNRTNLTTGTSCATSGPSFSVNNVSATEGGSLIFTISKTGTASGTTTIDYATANGTATAGSDYTAKSGTLTFLTGDTSKTVSVVTIDDAAVESAETLLFNLSNATGGATISDSQGTGTINDNDSAPTCSGVSFSIASNGAVTEGVNSVFTVTKSGTATGSCNVGYATANGTAVQPGDYTLTSGTLTFTTAQTSKTVSVPTIDDTTAESAETFSMSLSSPTGGAALGSPSSATATVNDNDSSGGVSFAINDVSVTEGGILTFTVTKTGATSATITINYATANDTAIAPGDYTAKSGTLSFGPSVTTQTVTIQTIDDTISEDTETLFVNLSGASGGATISDSQGLGSIIDNDLPNCGGSPPSC